MCLEISLLLKKIEKSMFFFALSIGGKEKRCTFAAGEMAEWSNAVVLKTIVPRGTGGSNPSFSAKKNSISKENPQVVYLRVFCFLAPTRKNADKCRS